MATRLQIRQGTNTENNNFTGASGELTFDTTNKEIRIHDGTTQGGITIANKQLLDTKLDKSISLNYSHITNCITEIPQDIKLELADGTLTLKAGSKVYIPNGAGVFDPYIIPNDITVSSWGGGMTDTTLFVQGAKLIGEQTAFCYSGATSPATTNATSYWYDTTNNQMKRTGDTGSTWSVLENCSLPICIIKRNSGVITSIDQVFNGFGYIGSTAFVLPGVKGLAPNGRNEDGTLKNRTITISAVSITTDVSGATGGLWYTIDNNSITRVNFGTFTFNEELNYFFNSSGQKYGFVIIDESSYRTNGKVTSLKPKLTFHAVDYNDSNYISQQGMPSSKYVNIPADKFATTGTAHTAPGNGYFMIRTVANIADCTLTFQSAQEPYYGNSLFIPQGNDGRLFVPVKKGDQVRLYYTNLGTGTGDQATVFNFIYSQGQ